METQSAKTIEIDRATIERHFENFRSSIVATGAVDKQIAESAVELLYSQLELDAPAIIWCQSYYQMLTMPSLLIGLLHSDIWELIAGDLTSRANQNKWNKYWNKIWPDIWLNGGMPLLTGMNRTTRISEFYGHAEGNLISQAKSQFGKALHSGRLDGMQHKLKREIYRRFWTPHSREVARDHWAKLKNDIFSTVVYVRDRNFDWAHWHLIAEEDERLHAVGEGVAGLFDLLADRLGGETRGQAGFILDLPAAVPWLGTAQILAEAWPEYFAKCAERLQLWLDLSQNASAVMCLDGVVFICEKPHSFHLTDGLRLHYETGPALAYVDGTQEFAWEGVLVPKFVIEDPESISVETIERADNIEVRRAMLDRFGPSRYIIESGVEPIHEDQYGILYRRELAGDEPLVLLRVVNSTAEPDGSFKEYFLRVPPHIEIARQAAAWTFEMDADDYGPLVET